MSHDNSEGYALLGFAFGLYTFYKGFRQFRNYLLLADTPEIAIRSIPMGFGEVHGKAEGEKTILSPISHTPCFVYKVIIERWKTDSNGEGGHWSHHRTDVDGVAFHLTDATGKVLVDAQGAELDLLQTATCKAGRGESAVTGVAATQQELLQYVTQADSHWAGGLFEHGLKLAGQSSDSAREQQRQALMEVFQHTPGTPEFLRGIMSMAAPKIQQHLESMGPQSDPKHEEARQTMLQALQHPPGSPEFMEGLRRAEQVSGKPGATNPIDELTQTLGGAPGAGLFSAADGRYRLTEYCLVPGGLYDISGTCVENPHPLDANDHNLIRKGASESVFLISCKEEKRLETGMRGRAVRTILFGAALTVGCAAILLIDFGLL